MKAIYAYPGAGQPTDLVFAAGTVLLVSEKSEDWCRGVCQGREGWFPTTYSQRLDCKSLEQKGIPMAQLVSVLRSPEWLVYATEDNKLYYVNVATQTTTWELPSLGTTTMTPSLPDLTGPLSGLAALSINPNALEALMALHNGPQKIVESEKSSRRQKPKMVVVNGVTFLEGGPEQKRLNPEQLSYVDHFWADKDDRTGYDVILEKHLNGKESMKDMAELFRERAAIEEQYSKGLLKLFKSALGEQEEGTLKNAWVSIKTELKYRSEAHATLASEIKEHLEKPLLEFKEAQKKGRKEHQQIMEKSRKQLQTFDANIEKTCQLLNKSRKTSKDESVLKRRSVAGDDLKKLEEGYNAAQRQWIDDMINACQDYEKQEDERSDYLKDLYFKYIELCVAVNEASAESLTRATDIIQRVDKKLDREFFIKSRGTGSFRPCERIVDL